MTVRTLPLLPPAEDFEGGQRYKWLRRLELERRLYERGPNGLMAFVEDAWRILNPATEFLRNWHHDLIAEHLVLAFRREIRRLVINVPPRFLKSTLCTVSWPCWCWAQDPTSGWIFGSHDSGLSTGHSLDRRTIMSSAWYRDHWPDVQFADDQNLKMQYQNTRRGEMIATSTGASVMGESADFIVIDDPHDPEKAMSETERAKALRWYDQQLSTRLNNKATGVIVVIMQRLHQGDLAGHVLELGGWTHVMLPNEAVPPKGETVERHVFPMSGRIVDRQRDELLHPARLSREDLVEVKKTLGSWGYAGQMQQDPVPVGGGIFKNDWWHLYSVTVNGQLLGGPCTNPKCNGLIHGLPSQFDETIQSWDCAFKDLEGDDHVAGHVWSRLGGDCYLRDRDNGLMNLPATCLAIEAMSARWPEAFAKLVEDKANGPAVISMMKHRLHGLIEVEPQGGKEARAHAVSPAVEAGNCFLPHPRFAPWIRDFLAQLSAFPKASHDDDVDACSQALIRLLGYGVPGEGYRQYLGQVAEEAKAAKVTTRTVLNPGTRQP